jgi:hypothetical protein
MKKIIPFLLLFIFIASCTSSEKQAQAELSNDELGKIFLKDMNEYFGLMNSGDYNKAFDFLPAKMFEMASKEQMIEMYGQMESRGMSLEMEIFKINEVSEVITDDNTNYCKFMSDGKITASFSGRLLEMKDQMVIQFEKQYEGAKIQIVEDKIEIELTQTFFAVSDENSTDWKYAEYSTSSKGEMYKIIPIEIINKLTSK